LARTFGFGRLHLEMWLATIGPSSNAHVQHRFAAGIALN
jgi:hypothetical protein